MNQDICELVLTTTQVLGEATAQTTNGIAKIKEISRTTGITKKQSSRLLLENRTNLQNAEEFVKLCNNNPGFLFVQTVGNMYFSNLGQVLKYAQKEFDKDEQVPDIELDNEWLMKFLETSGQCCDADKQKILAKVLSGEIKKPNSVSYRTLRILKDLTKYDIQLFKKALQCSLKRGRVMFTAQDFSVLSYSDILHLNECGLMSSNHETVYKSESNETNLLTFNNENLIIMKSKNKENINASCYSFTESAIELSQFITIEQNDIQLIKKSLEFYSKDYSLSMYKVNSINNNIINYNTTNLLA